MKTLTSLALAVAVALGAPALASAQEPEVGSAEHGRGLAHGRVAHGTAAQGTARGTVEHGRRAQERVSHLPRAPEGGRAVSSRAFEARAGRVTRVDRTELMNGAQRDAFFRARFERRQAPRDETARTARPAHAARIVVRPSRH